MVRIGYVPAAEGPYRGEMPGWPQPALPAHYTGGVASPPLVGRVREFERLEGVWVAVEAGAAQVVLVGGEPGAGKSRLAAEVARAVHRAGASVLFGSCGSDLARPFDPFVRPVATLLEALDAGQLEIPRRPTRAMAVSDLLRGVVEAGAIGPARAADRGASELALLDGVSELLFTACRERPLLLVLEDIHWAGQSGLRLLRYVVDHMDGAALLVLATQRSTPPDRSEALSAVVADLVRRDDVHRLDLGGLDVSDIVDYLVATGAGGPNDVRGPASLLRDHTGGNPFVLNEVWRDLAAGGGVDALRSGGITVPESLRSVLTGRLSRLPEAQRHLVCLGAIVGEVFEVEVVAGAAEGDVSLETAFDAMEAARAVGLVEVVADRPGRYRFAHALAQQAVQAELTPYEVARSHAAVAVALRVVSEEGPNQLFRLAHHYALATGLGLAPEAARYLRLAAEAAERQFALSDAAALFERAADHEGRSVERDRLILEAARCHLLAGHRVRALELDNLVAESDDPDLRLLAAIGFEAASARGGFGARHALALLRRAIQDSGRDDDDPLVIRATGSLASALAMCGEAEEGLRQSRFAIARARLRGDRDLLAAVLDASLFVGTDADSLREREEHAVELTAIAGAGGHWTALGRAAMVRCQTSYVAGESHALHRGLEDLASAAAETHQPYIRWTTLIFTASLHLMACDFDAARESMAQGRRLEAEFERGYSAGEGPSSLQGFMLRRETGRLGFAREALEAALDTGVPWRPGVVALCTELGLEDRARTTLRESLQHDLTVHGLPALRASATWPASMSFLGEAAAWLGEEEAMRVLLPEAERYSGLNLRGSEMLALLGSADLLIGLLRAGLGLPGVEHSFAAALDIDRRTGSVLHEATTHAHWASYLRGSGAPADRVRQHEEPARAVAQRRGLARVLRILGPQHPEALPDGLTAREVEVLRLLAGGASNRGIAALLVISEHTAANHVRSILMKTGSPNRTTAAHYAVRHRLVGDGSEHGLE